MLCAVLSQIWLDYVFMQRPPSSYSSAEVTGILAFYLVVALLLYPTEKARRAIRDRDQVLHELRAESNNKSHLLALLAHELRGPVHTALMALHLADSSDVGQQRRRDAHAVVRRQIEAVQKLSAELLDTAKTEQGKMSLARAPTTVGDLIQLAVERSQARLVQRGQQVRVSSCAKEVALDVDLTRMVQVISNLLDNASKYSPTGTTILLEASVMANTFSVKVTDQGRGFDPSHSENLFQPFFQAAPGSDGLGLGLPLVRNLVELHGGVVTATSAGFGMGATFEVRLPGVVISTPTSQTTRHGSLHLVARDQSVESRVEG